MAGSCGASTARACAPSTRRPSSARSIPACSRSRPPSTPTTSSIPARSRHPRTAACCGSTRSRRSGARERTIPVAVRESYDNALHCNGNGACYDFDARRRHVPVLEGHARAPALAQGPGLADARMAAADAGRRCRSGRRSGEATRHARVADVSGPACEHDRQASRRLRLLARGQGGDGRLPRLQGLRRPVPDQGRRAELPGEVLRALSRALSATGEGRAGRRDRASPARGGKDAGPLQPGGRQPAQGSS